MVFNCLQTYIMQCGSIIGTVTRGLQQCSHLLLMKQLLLNLSNSLILDHSLEIHNLIYRCTTEVTINGICSDIENKQFLVPNDSFVTIQTMTFLQVILSVCCTIFAMYPYATLKQDYVSTSIC